MKELNTEVFGISADSYASHYKFRQDLKLPFDLLSDWDRDVSKMYGVYNINEKVANRVTFLIDKKGKIVFKQLSGLNEPRNIKDIMKKVEEIGNEK